MKPSDLDSSTTSSPSSTSRTEAKSQPEGQDTTAAPRVTLLDLEATDQEIEQALEALDKVQLTI